MKRMVVSLLVIVFLVVAVFGQVSQVQAKDFASAFKMATKTFPPAANIAGMGGFWAGLPSPYSSNPASFPVFRKYGKKFAVYGAGSFINFSKGPDISIFSGTGITGIGPWNGVLRVDYYDFDSDRAMTKNGLDTKIRGKSLQIGYGFSPMKNLSLGFSITPYSESKATFQSPEMGELLLAQGKTREVFDARVGAIYNWEKVYFGALYEYDKYRLRTKTFNPYTFSYFPTTVHPVLQIIRPGIAIKPWKGATFGIDYLYGEVSHNGLSNYKVSQCYFGGEQWINKHLALRAGLADGHITAGFGLRWKSFILDYAFMERGMGEMGSYFGRSPTHLISLTFSF